MDVAVGTALGALVLLHVLRPELSPVTRRLSVYATGRHGWLMGLAFGAMTAGLVVLAVRLLRRCSSGWDRFFTVAVVVAAVGMGVSGMYRVGGSPAGEAVHSLASAVAVVAAVSGAVWWSVLRPAQTGARPGGDGWLAGAAVILALVSPVLHDGPWTGLGQRALWAAVGGWMFAANRVRAGDEGSG